MSKTTSGKHLSTCTIARRDGSFCGDEAMPDLPASVCPKHAARIFLHLRDIVGSSDRGDLALRLVNSFEQEQRARRRRATYRSAPEVVYYVRVGDHIKIGHTTNLRQRMNSYRTGTLLAVEAGDLRLEARRHRQFAGSLAAGREWFTPTPDLMQHIAAIAINKSA